MKNLILIPFCLFVVFISNAADGQVGVQQQVQSAQVQKQITNYRKSVEDYYSNKITELRLQMQTQIRLLEIAELPKPEWMSLSEWTRFIEAVVKMNGLDDKLSGRFKIVSKSYAERLAAAYGRLTERKSDILNKFEWEAARLNKQMEYALATGLNEYQERLNMEEIPEKPQHTLGVVAGILYAEDSSTALIDGEILREGQFIHGVKLVSIHKDKVEFEKNNKKWDQKVQQRLETYWR